MLLKDLSRPGAGGYGLPDLVVPKQDELPEAYRRIEELRIPEVTPQQIRREFYHRGKKNVSVDSAELYPLGSCSMIFTADLTRIISDTVSTLHYLQPEETVQGALEIRYDLERKLSELGGAAGGTLQPAAGADSERVAALMIAAYHESKGSRRKYMLIPDSAHGTNPATATMAGYEALEVPSDERGRLNYEKLNEIMREYGSDVAGLMITQPSTLGIFDEGLPDISGLLHEYDAQLYCDGANFISFAGKARFCDWGVDIYHLNLHKTLDVPHGGGGPGAGFVGVAEHLVPFLPTPVVEKNGHYSLSYDKPNSIGIVSPINGNFAADVMAYGYLSLMGYDGLKENSEVAVLNGNYMRHHVSEFMPIAFPGYTGHEFVALDKELRKKGVVDMDLAKYLINTMEFYAPTVGFPLMSKIMSNIAGEKVSVGCLLTEPTQSATKEAMDKFIEVLRNAVKLGFEDPDRLKQYPLDTPVRRVKEADSDRNPVWKWN